MSALSSVSDGSDFHKCALEALHQEGLALQHWAQEFVGSLYAFEFALLPKLWAFGALLLQVFVTAREQACATRLPPGPRRWASRTVTTTVGGVTLTRRCRPATRTQPQVTALEDELELTADRASRALMDKAVRLCTRMSFAQAREVLSWFAPTVPSQKAIQHAVLGLGYHTEAWLHHAPAPDNDGQVLVVMIDGKAIPTATDTELMRRRGKRRKRPHAPSARHRGRHRRRLWNLKKRRNKGDHSKNGRVATVAVVYTLRRKEGRLLGPMNKRVYVSFGPKELAFQWARHEATKRGFGPATTKTIQVVTDGDMDLERHVNRYFPKARHTVDLWHVLEYVWQAGTCVFPEGSRALRQWFAHARRQLLQGKSQRLLDELGRRLAQVSRRGPGTKGKRLRLTQAYRYLHERRAKMNYGWLRQQDLELGSGMVEGAVKHLVAFRFDKGGMRWIREHAQALAQLRCIEQNGQWQAFWQWVIPRLEVDKTARRSVVRLQRATPPPLPTLREAA